MKNKILALMLSVFLSMPISVLALEDTILPEEDNVNIETVTDYENLEQLENKSSTLDEEINDLEQVDSPYKQPISKKKIVKKFLIAMFGVVLSSLILYAGLTVYNKIRDGVVNQVKTPEGETPLQTPDDLDCAVRTFLDKTKW